MILSLIYRAKSYTGNSNYNQSTNQNNQSNQNGNYIQSNLPTSTSSSFNFIPSNSMNNISLTPEETLIAKDIILEKRFYDQMKNK